MSALFCSITMAHPNDHRTITLSLPLTLTRHVIGARLSPSGGSSETSGAVDSQVDLVHTLLDLSVYERVLAYWRVRVLPPSARGTLSVLGVVRVRDVAYYVQYYSVPLLSVFLTPVARLVIAVRCVYRAPTHGATRRSNQN